MPTTILFASGKISSHGATPILESKKAIEEAVDKGGNRGNSTLESIKIENVVAHISLKHEVDLDDLTLRPKSAIFEPDCFPAMILDHSTILLYTYFLKVEK